MYFIIVFMIILWRVYINTSYCKKKRFMIYHLLISILREENVRCDEILRLEILQSNTWNCSISLLDDSMITIIAHVSEKSISTSRSFTKSRSWFWKITMKFFWNLKNIIQMIISWRCFQNLRWRICILVSNNSSTTFFICVVFF